MKQRVISMVLAAAMVLGLCLPVGAEAAQMPPVVQVGRACPEGIYTMMYRSDLSMEDLPHNYRYGDQLFDAPATEYDHELALATLGLTIASSNTLDSDKRVWLDGDQGRENNIRAAYQTLGFDNMRFFHYDRSPNEYKDDTAGHALAQKTMIQPDGSVRTIVAVMVRGAGYGAEWAGNMRTGSGEGHAGMMDAAEEVFQNLRGYLAEAAQVQPLGEIKLWIGGFSRGGSIANLLAARVAEGLPEIRRENTYVYTFASPAAVTAGSPAQFKADFDHNHTADGQVKPTWDESNIHNMVASGDLVARILPSSWGYYRNGNDRFLPATQREEERQALDAHAEEMPGAIKMKVSTLATAEQTDALEIGLAQQVGGQQGYFENYQALMMDMLQCTFTFSEDEVRLGTILGNEAIIRRLRSLSNMSDVPLLDLMQDVLLANLMSRILLKRVGEGVPVRVQQLAGPLLAVGLHYGLDKETAQTLVQNLIEVVVVKRQVGLIMGAVAWHFPESYLNAMEYYPVSTHALEPTTRK